MTIEEIKKRLQEIVDALEDENSEADTEALEEESRNLTAELKRLEGLEARKSIAQKINDGALSINNVTPVKEERDEGNVYSTMEYRKAFMKYVLSGEKSAELRADATTKTTDIGSVIPTTIMNKIYEKIENFGKIYSKITKTNFKGGLAIPTSSLKPSASWVAEGSTSDKQKKPTGDVVFAYYKLQCKVAITLEAGTVSLEIFEDTVAKNITEAMVKALEIAVFQGTGVKQPTGIETEVEATEIESVDYATLVNIESNVDEAYDDTAEYYMTKKDFLTKVIGLVDSNKQPIARVNIGIDGKPAPVLFGRPVNYTPAEVLGNVFTVVGDLADYVMNSNYQMTMKKYIDEDTDEEVSKCTLIADGKLASKQSFQVVTIKTTTPTNK